MQARVCEPLRGQEGAGHHKIDWRVFRMFLTRRSVYIPLSDEISCETGTLARAAGVAAHHRSTTLVPNRALVILGAGTIGQLIPAFAKWKGYSPIIVTDTAEFNREFALKHGAAAAFNPLEQDVPAGVKKAHGRGADLGDCRLERTIFWIRPASAPANAAKWALWP